MPTILGVIRDVNRSINRIDREAKQDERRIHREYERAEREYAKAEKALQKQLEVELAELEFDHYCAEVRCLESAHMQCSDSIDWAEVLNQIKPLEPDPAARFDAWEVVALQKETTFKPSFWQKIFGRAEKQKAILKAKVEEARGDDEREFKRAAAKYDSEVKKWNEDVTTWELARKFALNIVSGDPSYSTLVLQELDLWTEIEDRANSILIEINNPKVVSFSLSVADSDVVPSECVKILKTGKVSKNAHSKKRKNEIYQDFVCSAGLRIGRETFAALPFPQLVIVTISGGILNTATGHHEDCPLLSVALSRSRMEDLNFSALDASDSMENFVHNMNYSSGAGFKKCEALDPLGFEKPA